MMMRNRIFWIVVGLLAFTLAVPLGISGYKDWEVYHGGSIVTVRLLSVPVFKGDLKFELDGKTYYKRLTGSLNGSVHAGDTIELRYLKGWEGHFLWPAENPIPGALGAVGLFLIFGFAGLYYAFRRDPP